LDVEQDQIGLERSVQLQRPAAIRRMNGAKATSSQIGREYFGDLGFILGDEYQGIAARGLWTGLLVGHGISIDLHRIAT
jgi:hypothetical protein